MEKVPDSTRLSQTAMRFPFSFRTPVRGSAVYRRRRRRPVRRRFPGGKRVLQIAVVGRTRGRLGRAGRTLARAGKRRRRREGTRSLYRRPPRVQLKPAGSSAAKTRNRVRGRGGRRTGPSRAGTPASVAQSRRRAVRTSRETLRSRRRPGWDEDARRRRPHRLRKFRRTMRSGRRRAYSPVFPSPADAERQTHSRFCSRTRPCSPLFTNRGSGNFPPFPRPVPRAPRTTNRPRGFPCASRDGSCILPLPYREEIRTLRK